MQYKKHFILSIFCFLISIPALSAKELPYAEDFNLALEQQLLASFKSKPSTYQARTEHFCKNNQPCYINRLILENSPYLLQHAHNPINWYKWGKEAIAKAKKEHKMIFLSIGYASCHWCHRMEKESFDNVMIAKNLNKNFIAIKVDREQSPDLDEFYANAVRYFQGQQGWPMTLFLTPDGDPIYAGGYYSNKELSELLNKMQKDWHSNQANLIQQAKDVVLQLQQQNVQNKEQKLKLNEVVRRRAIKDLLAYADGYNGGFGESQKFPREAWLFLLLNDSYQKQKNNDSLRALLTTLDHIARGGIYDQLGGGFHRYATDPNWLIPHFEKMLYNQALLIQLYIAANNIKPNAYYRRIAKQTIDFVLTQMRSPQGGFYAALDADTEDQEGAYYLWNVDEYKKALKKNKRLQKPFDIDFSMTLFDVDEIGELANKNVLYLPQSYLELAEHYKISLTQMLQVVDAIRNSLQTSRKLRPKPALDKKILMGWNALMISSFVRSSQVLNEFQQGADNYIVIAKKTAEFIWQKMSTKNQQAWYRSHYQGNNSEAAHLDDYAYYLQALIDLYDISQEKKWLDRAEKIVAVMLTQLWDKEQGGFFQSPINEEAKLPFRSRSAFDKTLPSGNAIAAKMLIRLARRTGKQQYIDYARTLFLSFASAVFQTPSAFSALHIAADELRNGQQQLPLYGAQGNLRIDAVLLKSQATNAPKQQKKIYPLEIEIKIKPNWHINSHQPKEKYLIATHLELVNDSQWELVKLEFPVDEIINLGFNEKPLALYQGTIKIKALLYKTKRKKIKKKYGVLSQSSRHNPIVKLTLQACSDEICLLPEQFILYPRNNSKE